MKHTTRVTLVFAVMTIIWGAVALATLAQAKKPNILVIFGDDVGYWNVSAYNHGMIGYRTPNIDRLAKQGALHRLLRAAELHGGARGVYHRPEPDSHRADQGRAARLARWVFRSRTQRSPNCSSRSDT